MGIIMIVGKNYTLLVSGDLVVHRFIYINFTVS